MAPDPRILYMLLDPVLFVCDMENKSFAVRRVTGHSCFSAKWLVLACTLIHTVYRLCVNMIHHGIYFRDRYRSIYTTSLLIEHWYINWRIKLAYW